MYEMTDEKWKSVLDFLREDFKHPERIPDKVLLLSLSREELAELFTRRRMELIEVIKGREPETLSKLAEMVDRKLPAVERDVKILEGLGVVKLEKKGREVRPSVEKEVLILPLVEPIRLEEIKTPVKG